MLCRAGVAVLEAQTIRVCCIVVHYSSCIVVARALRSDALGETCGRRCDRSDVIVTSLVDEAVFFHTGFPALICIEVRHISELIL